MSWKDEDVASTSWSDADVVQKPAPASFLKRALHGAMDPIIGAAQLADKVINPVRQMISPGAASMSDVIRQRDAEYQAPEGVDWARVAGNVANPVSWAGGGAGVLRGAAGGALQGALAPVAADSNFAEEKTKQAGVGALAGGVLPAALGAATRGAGKAASAILGTTTGAGTEAVEQAFKGSPTFVKSMRGETPPTEVVDQARTGLKNMRQQMYDAYATAKNGWAGDTTPLPFKPITDAVDAASSKFSFKDVPQPGTEEVRKQVRAVVGDWEQRGQADPSFFTVEGLDALKRHLQSIVPDNPANHEGRAYVTEVVNKVKDTILNQAPKYREAMKDYWSRSNELDEIERSLSLGNRSTVDTAFRKLLSADKNAPNQRAILAKTLSEKGGEDLVPAIAGQNMQSLTPRGTGQRTMAMLTGAGGTINPGAWAVLPAFSPRAVGEVAYKAGQGYNAATPLLNALRRIAPAATRDFGEEQ